MRGIAGLMNDLFNSNPNISFEEAHSEAKAKGYNLKLGTYRVNKSNWKKLQSVKEEVAVGVQPEVESAEDFVFEGDVEAELKEFFVPPTVDDTHVINQELQTLFDALNKASQKRPQNVRLNGPAGCGKTTTAMEFAARFNRPMLVMDCANVREPRDWFGHKDYDPKSGTITWKKSLFYRMVQHKGAVIVLDEVNRINPMVLNTLLPLLDDRRKTYLEEAKSTIKVGEGVVFFATTNEGREYTGTVGLDLAQADRLSTLIEVSYLPEKQEADLLHKRTELSLELCTKLCQVANQVRRKAASDGADSFSRAISTRMLLNAAEKMVLGGPSTLRYTLLTHYSSEGGEQSERGQLLKLLVGKFGPVIQ